MRQQESDRLGESRLEIERARAGVGDKTSLRLELGGGLDTLGSEQINTRLIEEITPSQIFVILLTLYFGITSNTYL